MEMHHPVAAHPDAESERRLQRAEAKVSRLETRVAALETRVAQLRDERAALWWAVGHDELTGLANRRLFYAAAPTILNVTDHTAAVIVLDLNDFKPINDTFGHEVGDNVLRLVARRLAGHASGDLVARLGGDEFAAVLTHPREQATTHWWRATAAALSAILAEPMRITDRVLTVTASIGVAPATPRTPIEELVRRADLAMYEAKASGGDRAPTGEMGTGDALHGVPCHQPALRPRHLRREAGATAGTTASTPAVATAGVEWRSGPISPISAPRPA